MGRVPSDDLINQDQSSHQENQLVLVSGACCIGKKQNFPDDQVESGKKCEDAFFILQDRAFGLSDGVSGWNDYGFSSSRFSE